MYYDELQRIRDAFQTLPRGDDARLKQLCRELETVTRKALPKEDAARYAKSIDGARLAFYPGIYFDDIDDTPRTWPQGQAEMVGVVDSILYNTKLKRS